MEDYYSQYLDRIISLLTEIRDQTSEKEKPKKRESKKQVSASNDGMLFIRAYCDAFRARYGTNPYIDGKSAGIVKDLLKCVSLSRAVMLVQAYCQMEDKWFLIKCHDLVTFSQNLNKVAVALSNGTSDPHEKSFWVKVFGASSGATSLPAANDETCPELGRAQLQSGEGGASMEGVPEHKE